MTKVVIDISGQGYGHLAQIAPVVMKLRLLVTDLDVVLRTIIPQIVISQFIGGKFRLEPPPPEALMSMRGATEINLAESNHLYEVIHKDWAALVKEQAEILSALKPKLLISNISYLSLAAASRLNIPSFAVCSMNWLEIYSHYFSQSANALRIMRHMHDAYSSARVFFQLQPHMTMINLSNKISVGPIGRIGISRREYIQHAKAIEPKKSIVLLTSGGLDFSQSMNIPESDQIHWILQGVAAPVWRRDISSFTNNEFPFIDLIATADVIVAKDSYGTAVETAMHGKRMVMAPRPDWPEAPYIVDWMSKSCAFINEPLAFSNEKKLLAAVQHILKKTSISLFKFNSTERVTAMIVDQIKSSIKHYY